ncbi:hypothetical protein [Yersinia pseudotuberculosis]|uniref:hypothetical protein n=1 Tax=Yersinia pseudotuberculosis TaxID=633 RepID=UPI00034837BA|nr:hypothetical protein [Yersinia pseudotuberculosis]QES99141.1 hypothetical protein FOB73_12995 [Yersinia pseudotuberculosis]
MEYSLIVISAKCFDNKLKKKRNSDIQILFQSLINKTTKPALLLFFYFIDGGQKTNLLSD